jgi:hypothetical protein
MGEQESQERPVITQKRFSFRLDGTSYYYPLEIIPELSRLKKKGYRRVNIREINNLLSERAPETDLSREQLLGRTLKLTYGVLAHRFYALSGAMTLLSDNTEPDYLKKNLPNVLRTWRAKGIEEAVVDLSQLNYPREEINIHDYRRLAEVLSKKALESRPFAGNIPLPLIFPGPEDRLPTPEEINQEWKKQEMDQKFEKFANACYRLHRQYPGSEFKTWNRRNMFFEADCILLVDCQEDLEEQLKLVIPMRMDCLWYSDVSDDLKKPIVYDLKTSISLKDLPKQPKATYFSLAPQLYMMAVAKKHLDQWTRGEAPLIRIKDHDFIRPEDVTSGLVSPAFVIRRFSDSEETGEITEKSPTFPPSWRSRLRESLVKVQEKLKEKEEEPLRAFA